ncbi:MULTISPECIES: hypothetical protein [Methylocaldum]|jgi:hypothetical protein|uniref:hypothetical protein n=1 Tax=unclassified Methylocaldum TaxID=2622260 RepID=UPI00098A25C8|nr:MULTISPECIES: hypothetical protein [unclassified Methylocaldum]MBP1152920.1 hypothetical protein [Methylocaldum sp. RMAD-M]MDV3241581.1 hypothetical protein [Methylocaldum sp.]MVF22707.1 hypothetical protein [Methylocaldum sp. BRCS4]
MKKSLFLTFALLFSANVFASTDHYIRREGDHVQHLKIRKFGDDIKVTMDVDFEPTGSTEEGRRSCSAEISGEAKAVSENEIVLKKQAEGEAHYCALRILLSNDGAKVEQSPDCKYFVAGICHFDSEGRELIKVK